MEEIFAFIFVAVIFLGYLALCAGVGYFAHKNDQSFILFFVLAIIFSPIPIFVVVIILSVATGTLGASNERKEGAHGLQERARERGPSTPNGDGADEIEPDTERSFIQRSSADKEEDEEGTGDVAGEIGVENRGAMSDEDADDEPYPWEKDSDDIEEDVGSGEPAAPEGKVRCDVCHSFVDEEEERCPACGNRLE